MRKAQRVIKPITSDLQPLTSCLFPLLVMALLCTSCWREPEYPRQLVEADSAMRWGRYNQADSLIASYQHAAPKRELRAITRYHQLLVLESKFLHGQPSLDDLLLADSLREYYGGHSLHDKHAKALAILGDIYHANDDYPSALNSLLHAEEEAAKDGELWLQGIICREEGQIYLDQRMFDDMEVYFRRSQHIATICNDTLRMAHAAFYMGVVCTYLQKIDSVIFYYERAIKLGGHIYNPAAIVPRARYQLADIYLQIEEFDKAAASMSRDSIDDVNWGYWHYYQNHVDSAIFYFQKSIDHQSLIGQSELLRLLAELEERRGNTDLSLTYTKKDVEIEDSIKAQSQVAATLQAEAQHKLDVIKSQLRDTESKTRNLWGCIALAFIAFGASFIVVRRQWTQKKAEKDAAIAYEKLMRQEEEQQHKLSLAKIEENNQELARLNEELKKAHQMNDNLLAARLKLNAKELQTENNNIKTSLNRRAYLLDKLKNSSLYNRVKVNAGKEKFHLTEEEWQTLAADIDNAYDNFTGRLLTLANFDDIEMKVCYLIKLEISPSAIATMLYQTRGAITMKRRRMHEKLLHIEKGDSKKFDEFILNF